MVTSELDTMDDKDTSNNILQIKDVLKFPISNFSSSIITGGTPSVSAVVPSVENEEAQFEADFYCSSAQSDLLVENLHTSTQFTVKCESEPVTEAFLSETEYLIEPKEEISVEDMPIWESEEESSQTVIEDVQTPQNANSVPASDSLDTWDELDQLVKEDPPELKREEEDDEVSEEEPHRCSERSKSFLTTRKRVLRSFRCAMCNSAFRFNAELRRHVRTHSGERPFRCEFCEAAFVQRTLFVHHIRKHTGDLPFQCQVCSASFVGQAPLSVHVRTHAGEKPYACESCDLSFSRVGSLAKHSVRKHGGQLLFRCDACNASCSTKSDLALHMRKHSGDCPFQCEVCRASFNRSVHLTTHLAQHTGEIS